MTNWATSNTFPRNTVLVKVHDPVRNEGIAAATIKPGYLIALTGNTPGMPSGYNVTPHATAGAATPVRIAVEDVMQGKSVGDSYASGARVQYIRPEQGDELLVPIAASQTLVVGDKLTSNGDGTFKKASGSDAILLECKEAVTTGSDVLWRVAEVC